MVLLNLEPPLLLRAVAFNSSNINCIHLPFSELLVHILKADIDEYFAYLASQDQTHLQSKCISSFACCRKLKVNRDKWLHLSQVYIKSFVFFTFRVDADWSHRPIIVASSPLTLGGHNYSKFKFPLSS